MKSMHGTPFPVCTGPRGVMPIDWGALNMQTAAVTHSVTLVLLGVGSLHVAARTLYTSGYASMLAIAQSTV